MFYVKFAARVTWRPQCPVSYILSPVCPRSSFSEKKSYCSLASGLELRAALLPQPPEAGIPSMSGRAWFKSSLSREKETIIVLCQSSIFGVYFDPLSPCFSLSLRPFVHTDTPMSTGTKSLGPTVREAECPSCSEDFAGAVSLTRVLPPPTFQSLMQVTLLREVFGFSFVLGSGVVYVLLYSFVYVYIF